MPTITATPDLLATVGLALPETASDISVDAVTHTDFCDVTVARFTAPRTDAEAFWAATNGVLMEGLPVLPYEQEMLGAFTPEPGTLTGTAPTPDATSQLLIFVAPGDTAQVTLLAYRIPAR